ncbi:hypothetical protein PYW07_014203 [Mythimna separata]|uniref:Uncharacterized protein n=1 Tax=Mythimna separata TaxID=271217 RepID=A0AAD7YXX2_MYTSE|nr:hypothetical protein PYW07_014203 [Mythimna separata]
MPKRKNSRSREEDINHYKNKIKKLERKIRDRQISASESVSDLEEAIVLHDEDIGADTPALRPDDWLLEWPPEDETAPEQNSNKTCEPQPGPSTSTDVTSEEPIAHDVNIPDLDTDILDILGDDPTNTDKYGPEIRNEVANRLLYIAKDGLNKENRKNLMSKYVLPKNCIQLDAPKINLEIKAAIADTAIKRDKGIENKQKQMSSAIACLADIINAQLNSKTITNDVLQKLMDISRILCDLQHADSITRRNFILFALKNDMKEHLKNTKIDTYLFGENLAETLKSAKAVNKSGIELKAEASSKTANTYYKGPASRALNRRAPPQARRPPAGPAPAPRSREPAASRAQYPPPQTQYMPPHAHSSKTSSRGHQSTYPRRRF